MSDPIALLAAELSALRGETIAINLLLAAIIESHPDPHGLASLLRAQTAIYQAATKEGLTAPIPATARAPLESLLRLMERER